jgi:EpsI family protein
MARYGLLAAACLILVVQASASRMLKIDERSMPIPGLHNLPWQLGNWKAGAEDSIGAATEAYLKPDEYVLREYADTAGGTPINLFVAYFKSLQNSYGPHSPSVCLPASGWLVTSHRIVNIPAPGRPEGVPANQVTMEKQDQRILVLYWYQNDRNIWADEVYAKFRLLSDLLRYHRSDVTLVRLVMPLRSSSADNEVNQAVRFTARLFPPLSERLSSVH